TGENPIVIRGESIDGVILDGQNCDGCNNLEVTGSFIHVERMTMRNATRGMRYFGETRNNVARRIKMRNVVHGIGATPNQSDYYVCDNDIEGRNVWPWVFAENATSHWDDEGINVMGDGHVVCHNRIVGFGDP